MTALNQALELQNQAIELLLNERNEIDHRLAQLGHGQQKTALPKKRGRKPKLSQQLSQPDTTEAFEPSTR
jgi:hypothetical protein